MTTAQAEAEKLLTHVLPFAEQMLAQYGQFIPYGGALRPSGEFAAVSASTGRDGVPSQQLIDLLELGLRDGAAAGDYLATALVYDVRVAPPGAAQPADAVAAELEHRDGYAVTVFYPYSLIDGQPLLGSPFATAQSRSIFPK